MPLTALDYVLLGIVVLSVLIGALRGVVREALSLLAWFVGLWAASRYDSVVASLLESLIASGPLRLWAARLLLLVAVLLAGGLLTWILGMVLHGTRLAGTDRVIGMVFGLARGVLLAGLAVIVLRVAGFGDEPWCRQSKLLPYAQPVADALREAAEQGLGGLSSALPGAALPLPGRPTDIRS